MTTTPVGTRVVAIRDADNEEIRIFGRGVYAGDHPRPGAGSHSDADRAMAEKVIRDSDAKPFDPEPMYDALVAEGKLTRAEANEALVAGRSREAATRARPMAERVTDLLSSMDLNPRIDLDGGGTVWGFQCWWGDETRFEKFRGERRVVEVPTPDRQLAGHHYATASPEAQGR